MGKRLPDGDALPIDCDTYQPDANPLEIRDCGVLRLSVAVWAENEQVGRVMSDLGVKVVHLKIRLAIRFLEGE